MKNATFNYVFFFFEILGTAIKNIWKSVEEKKNYLSIEANYSNLVSHGNLKIQK